MGNDGHVPDIGRLVHERTDLHSMLVMLQYAESREISDLFDGEAVIHKSLAMMTLAKQFKNSWSQTRLFHLISPTRNHLKSQLHFVKERTHLTILTSIYRPWTETIWYVWDFSKKR